MEFRQYLENQSLAPTTINNHMKNIGEYGKIGESQRIMVNKIEALKQTLGTRLSMAGSISKYLKFKQQTK
jgi:hypothetical protein